jgi:tetratricopeptide (TPR) repeat protein
MRYESARKLPTAMALAALCAAFALAPPPVRAQVAVDKSAAREHWARAKALWDAQRREEAAKELDAAYRLWPDPTLLYNIGALDAELGRPAEAAAALETYLEQERARISPRRKNEIEAVIAKQLAVVGTIEIRATPEGVTVRLDDKEIGKTPLERAVRAAQGPHTVELTREGYAPQQRRVEVQARSRLLLDVNLAPLPSPAAAPKLAPPPEPAAAPRPAVAPAPVPVVARSAAAGGSHVAGTVIASSGMATAIVGGVIAWKFSRDANTAAEAPMADPQARERAQSDYDTANGRRLVGLLLVGVGAIATAVGGYIFFGSASVAPGSASVAVGGRF